MKFDTIYSLGSRCQNSEILKHYGYREFSGIFDFMNTSKFSVLNHILKNEFKELFETSNNINIKCDQLTIDPETGERLPSSFRTMNKFYNTNLDDIHSSIFPHHDLTKEKDQNHFKRCVERFYKLNNFNVLFNYTYNTWENTISLKEINEILDSFNQIYKFQNYRICFIGLIQDDNNKFKLETSSNLFDIWSLKIKRNSFSGGLFNVEQDNLNYLKIIKTYLLNTQRISKEDIDLIK